MGSATPTSVDVESGGTWNGVEENARAESAEESVRASAILAAPVAPVQAMEGGDPAALPVAVVERKMSIDAMLRSQMGFAVAEEEREAPEVSPHVVPWTEGQPGSLSV